MSIQAFISKRAEWIYRAMIASGIAASLWLNSRYVTRSEFEAVKADVSQIKTTLLLMAEQNKVNERQDVLILDHEHRIRLVERK